MSCARDGPRAAGAGADDDEGGSAGAGGGAVEGAEGGESRGEVRGGVGVGVGWGGRELEAEGEACYVFMCGPRQGGLVRGGNGMVGDSMLDWGETRGLGSLTD